MLRMSQPGSWRQLSYITIKGNPIMEIIDQLIVLWGYGFDFKSVVACSSWDLQAIELKVNDTARYWYMIGQHWFR